ncbi:MAG: hypothetical protein ABIF40_00275 [archaeon]
MKINLSVEYYLAGLENLKNGEFLQAQVLFVNSIIHDSNNLEAAIGLYEISRHKENFEEETIKVLKRATQMKPSLSCMQQHRTIDEVTDLLARYMVGTAEFYIKTKRHDESKIKRAVELMEEAFELKPYLKENFIQDYALMLYKRAETFSRLDDAQKSYEIFKQEINENPDNPTAQIGLKSSRKLIKELIRKD